MKTKPVFNFMVEIVPMKPSAIIQAAEIIQEVNSLARRLQFEQAGKKRPLVEVKHA